MPRILRTPGTLNYKLGKDHAPLCHIIEDSGLRFDPIQFDEKLNATIQTQKKKSHSESNYISNSHHKRFSSEIPNFVDDRDFNVLRVHRMLDFISPSSLTYDEWLAVGMALKNIGCDCSDWENWSRNDDRFKDGECESKWNGFNRDGYDIGTIFIFAQQGGYDVKETYRQ